MRTVESEIRSLVRVSAEVPGLRPWRFLRRSAGEPRGFWGLGDRWIAHSGSLLTIEFDGAGPGGGASRFEHVREAGRALREAICTGPEPDESGLPSPRLFGGFAFAEDHRASGVWAGFPSARFVLPAVEVRGKPEGVRIIVQELAPTDDGLEDRVEALEARLARLVRDLAGGGEEVAGGAGDGSWFREPGPKRARTDGWEPWRDAVEEVLRAVRSARVSKVVLARTLDLRPEAARDPLRVLGRLHSENHASHVFLFEPAPGTSFLGAAPETVATLQGSAFQATAVAGSAPVGRSDDEAREHARRLLSSEKDLREHAVTVREMLRCLGPFVEELEAEDEPHVLRLPGIQHLETKVRGRVHPGEHVLSLLAAVHPTPAVCGLPRRRALDLIREEEPFDRGWYAGPVGWFDLEGEGIFAPALRSAVRREDTWRLFAGAGLVEGSVAEDEWEETGLKFDPVLRALGLDARP